MVSARHWLVKQWITAVMVGENQPLVGNDFSGAASAELDYRIFETGMVDVVNLLGGKFKPLRFHVLVCLFVDVHQQPHTLVRLQQRRECKHACNE